MALNYVIRNILITNWISVIVAFTNRLANKYRLVDCATMIYITITYISSNVMILQFHSVNGKSRRSVLPTNLFPLANKRAPTLLSMIIFFSVCGCAQQPAPTTQTFITKDLFCYFFFSPSALKETMKGWSKNPNFPSTISHSHRRTPKSRRKESNAHQDQNSLI